MMELRLQAIYLVARRDRQGDSRCYIGAHWFISRNHLGDGRAAYRVVTPEKPNAKEACSIWLYQLHGLKVFHWRPAVVGRKVDVDEQVRPWLVVLPSFAP
jgi:hypothetical protein